MKFIQDDAAENVGFQIAPLVDIVFLLLIFFMCVTTFSMMEQEIEIQLPHTSEGIIEKGDSGDFIINVLKNGEIAYMGKTLSLDELKNVLQEAQKDNPDMGIVLRGDENTKHGSIMAVLDMCIEAGVYKIRIRSTRENSQVMEK